jgi:hypothetical protein
MSGHLETLFQTFADYEDLRKMMARNPDVDNLPKLKMVGVKSLPPKQIKADDACFDMLVKAVRATDQYGWSRFQSCVDWTGQSDAPVFGDAGAPLFAEWTTSTQESCRLRTDPDNPTNVLIWTYTERDFGKNDALQTRETAFLRETVTVLGHHRRLRDKELVYHIYWAAPKEDDAHALRRVFDRFAGIQTMESK